MDRFLSLHITQALPILKIFNLRHMSRASVSVSDSRLHPCTVMDLVKNEVESVRATDALERGPEHLKILTHVSS